MVNPNDVFPRRNLPGEAEEWGRQVEKRIQYLEGTSVSQQTGLKSENRTSASSLQELSRQLTSLREVVNSLPVTRQANASVSGVGGLGGGWNTIASASLVVPSSMNRVKLLGVASGQLVSTTTTSVVQTSARLNLVGVGASPALAGAWFAGNGDFRNVLTPEWSWDIPVQFGTPLTVEFQIQPQDANAYPANGNSYAVLSLIGTFTGQ